MTPTKKSNRGASTGLVLLVFSIVSLVAGPVGARAAMAPQGAEHAGMVLEVVAPGSHSLKKRYTRIAVTGRPVASTAPPTAYRAQLALSYEDHTGRTIPATPLAHPGICHWGSDRAGSCWVSAGETITFTRGVARGAETTVRRALRRGPVWMVVKVKGEAQDGGSGSEVAKIRLTR